MTTSVTKTSEVMLERIDAMMRELQALREAVLSLQEEPPGQITKQLFGSLGQGTPDEVEDKPDIYTQIFEQ